MGAFTQILLALQKSILLLFEGPGGFPVLIMAESVAMRRKPPQELCYTVTPL
jgi:hypothetical protein